ncbi:hypothetical protein MA6G0728R_5357 [Mycobacteroides abscessus 6G-0728-R]|nr:hypothetical protein MA6G0125S_5405 [Mycobacteroides abscessus 6G-0125-S]EIU64212.1 hypothetical protein MA6G0728S_5329 [Mycobacteroides abscessus 6G-0728-S]EIU74760.1 hypothetical protein MA6G1108_5408 [Mycobacteroides abscessus 6G-1108]EIV03077.1 hypothetical protein MA6G0728R_5357 [Mycobacteroides abscessus 6G-0728-R]
MIGRNYWATGITLRFATSVVNGVDGWSAAVEFYDDGFGGPDFTLNAGRVSTEGELRTRYFVSDGDERVGAVAAAEAVKHDATRMGIKFVVDPIAGSPLLYLHRDNWANPDTECGSDEVEATLGAVALAIGWIGARDWLLVPTGVTVSNTHAIGDPDVAPTLRINPSAAALFNQSAIQ